MRQSRLSRLVISALLCAIGVVIPMFSPIRLVLEPASFTLGSHIATMLAMLLAPSVAVAVSLGTALGFLLGGFPLLVVLRATTHVVFAVMGSVLLRRWPDILDSTARTTLLSFFLGVVHAACEVAVVTPFYFGNGMAQGYYARGYITSVLLLVGVGTILHSMVDFALAQLIWRVPGIQKGFCSLAATAKS